MQLPIGVWGGAPEADAILSIWYQMECILGSCLPEHFQKLGDRPNLFESWGRVPLGPIGCLRLWLQT